MNNLRDRLIEPVGLIDFMSTNFLGSLRAVDYDAKKIFENNGENPLIIKQENSTFHIFEFICNKFEI